MCYRIGSGTPHSPVILHDPGEQTGTHADPCVSRTDTHAFSVSHIPHRHAEILTAQGETRGAPHFTLNAIPATLAVTHLPTTHRSMGIAYLHIPTHAHTHTNTSISWHTRPPQTGHRHQPQPLSLCRSLARLPESFPQGGGGGVRLEVGLHPLLVDSSESLEMGDPEQRSTQCGHQPGTSLAPALGLPGYAWPGRGGERA